MKYYLSILLALTSFYIHAGIPDSTLFSTAAKQQVFSNHENGKSLHSICLFTYINGNDLSEKLAQNKIDAIVRIQ